MRGGLELLTNGEMSRADKLAAARDVASRALMEAAGIAVAATAGEMLQSLPRHGDRPQTVLVICGRGNNGGDGFVAARHLGEAGYGVRVALLGSIAQLRGDAALAAADWLGAIEAAGPESLKPPVDLIVDALLGAGLAGGLRPDFAELISAINSNRHF